MPMRTPSAVDHELLGSRPRSATSLLPSTACTGAIPGEAGEEAVPHDVAAMEDQVGAVERGAGAGGQPQRVVGDPRVVAQVGVGEHDDAHSLQSSTPARGRRPAGYGPRVPREREVVEFEAGDRTVPLSSPGKVMFPEFGLTKLDVVDYYRRIERPALGAMRGRPVLMERFPNGVGGSSFFQKRVPKDAPDWLETSVVSTPNGTTSDALVDRRPRAHRVGGEPRLPRLPRVAEPRRPTTTHADELRIDLDPQPGTDFDEAREAAHEVRTLLDELGHRRAPEDHRATAASTCTCASRPRWTPIEVRAGAVAVAPRARPPPARPPHRRVVEGGARRARLRRLQPERAAQDGVRRVVGAGARPARRCRRRSRGTSSTPSTPTRAPSLTVPERVAAARRPVGATSTPSRSRSRRCSRSRRATSVSAACTTRRGRPSTRRCRASRPASRPSRAKKASD